MSPNTRHVPTAVLRLLRRAYQYDPAATESDLHNLMKGDNATSRGGQVSGIDWGMVLIELKTDRCTGDLVCLEDQKKKKPAKGKRC